MLKTQTFKVVDVGLLRACLDYDAATGRLIWKARPREMFPNQRAYSTWNARYAGNFAFTRRGGNGYLSGGIKKVSLMAHRVVWAICTGNWPDAQIDHINGVRNDNRIKNLRVVSEQENRRNMAVRADSKTGVIGVAWNESAKRWRARITIDGHDKHIGHFVSLDLAVTARKAAERKYGFHENHGRTAS